MNLTTIIPAYAYRQYQDDEDISAWFTAYNKLSQANLDAVNGYTLPIYLNQTGALLSWAASSIYGIPRPNLSSGGPRPVGPIDTWEANSEVIDGFSLVNTSANFVANDLTYQRIIQWNTFKGDGYDFTIRWLKRRVERFLHGEIFPEQTYDVSVSFTSEKDVLISVSSTNLQVFGGAFFNEMGFNDQTAPLNSMDLEVNPSKPSPLASALKAAINSGVLLLPFQYTFTVQI